MDSLPGSQEVLMSNTPIYSIRLDPALKERGKIAATLRGITLAELLKSLLENYLSEARE